MNQNEKGRLAALKQYNILDTLPEADLDALVKLASEICQVPIALISLIDENRQWFKANQGLDADATPRNISFCQYAIEGSEVYEVENASDNALFASNPLVTGYPNIRFYAGAPLTSPEGFNIGTLCVIDTKPKTLTEDQKASLKTLSKFVISFFELRKTRGEMDESRQHYQSLVEKAADIIYTCNTRGEFTFVSAAVERISGFKSSELIGKHFTDIVAVEHRRRIRSFYFEQYAKGIVETRMEFPMLMAGGGQKWIEQTVVLILRDGKKDGFQGVVRDIEERKAIEQELSMANQRFEKIFNQSPVAMTLASLNPSRFIEVNPSFTELTGYSTEDVKGLNSSESGLFSGGERTKLLAAMEKAGHIRHHEIRLQTKSKEERWVLLSTEPIENHGHLFSLSVYINITVRKKKEEELEQTRNLLSEAMSIGRMGSYENNLQTGKMTWSKEIFDIMDMDHAAEAMGVQEFMKVMQPDDRAGAAERIKNATEKLEPYITQNRITTATGREKWIELRVVPMADGSGKLSRFRGTMQDITEGKQLQQELIRAKEQAEESGKAKELFLANMSHEIRTPMNAVLGFTGLLSETGLDKKQQEYLHAIETSGKNLMTVINDILDYSKIEAGMLSIESIPMSIRSLFISLAVSFNGQAKQKKLKLTFSSDKNIPEVLCGDPARLTQIIINLVGNAIKFTTKGSVKVSADMLERKGSQVKIGFSISDTGIGIAGDQLRSVFERFNQGSSDTSRNYGGTGLGLSIVKKLAGLQGGSISVTSVYGTGSTFCVILPYKIEEEEAGREEVQPGKKTKVKTRELQVLVAEDNKLNQKLAEKVLGDFGFKVDMADNGKIAVDMLGEKQYDLVLMDMQMPEMNGYEATQIIRQQLGSKVPIIAMTAHAMASEREKCLKLGMNEYISKPYKKEELYNKIVAVVGKRHKNGADVEVVLDMEYLDNLAGGNKEFINEILEIFVSETPREIRRINKALRGSDHATLQSIAHKLRSSTGLIGLSQLAPQLEAVEFMAEDKKPIAEIEAHVKNLVVSLNAAIKAAKKLLA